MPLAPEKARFLGPNARDEGRKLLRIEAVEARGVLTGHRGDLNRLPARGSGRTTIQGRADRRVSAHRRSGSDRTEAPISGNQRDQYPPPTRSTQFLVAVSNQRECTRFSSIGVVAAKSREPASGIPFVQIASRPRPQESRTREVLNVPHSVSRSLWLTI